MQAGNDGAGDMRDVCKHPRADALRNFTDTFEVNDARIRRRATHQQLRFVLLSEPLQLVVIDRLGLARYAIVSNLVTQS